VVKEEWNGRLAAMVKAAGITVIDGAAHFANTQEIVVTDKEGGTKTMRADAYIVTSGSVPIFPPGLKPDGKRVIAPRFASALDQLPHSIVVIGGGVTGTEFVYLFNQLGVEVTWVVDQFGVLPAFDAEAGAFMVELFQKRGVRIVAGQPAAGIDRDEQAVHVRVGEMVIDAEMAFVAIGRKPDVANLQLEAAGLPLENGTTAVNRYGRTAQPHIYLAGDVTGNPMVANRALAQAWVAGNHAAGADVAPFRPASVVAAVYTAPQVAMIGRMTERSVRVEYTAAMKPHLLAHTEGFVKLAVAEDGRIAGAVAVGDHAADLLAPVAVAIQAQMTAAEFAAVYPAHPTMGELAFMAARKFV
jgi:pyruvate/2-oxoglutarate dehydrogenase complex dihydrolipoamide dehydrogenase (E3) component